MGDSNGGSVDADIWFGHFLVQGKEFETRLRQKKPGELSDELRRALGMPTGVVSHQKCPPSIYLSNEYHPLPAHLSVSLPPLRTLSPISHPGPPSLRMCSYHSPTIYVLKSFSLPGQAEVSSPVANCHATLWSTPVLP